MAKIKMLKIPKPPKPYPFMRTVLGRAVIHHSPDKHPEQGDRLGSGPKVAYAEGGPNPSDGSVSYVKQRRPSRRF